MLPFTEAQFFELFAAYNDALWPAAVVAYALALASVGAVLFFPGVVADRVLALALALMWLWTGIAYHWFYFASLSSGGYLFGAAFVLEGAALLYCAVQHRLGFGPAGGMRGALALALIAYALVVYPLLGVAMGERWPALPLFGMAPCPVTIFTFGCLLLARKGLPRPILVIPVLWSLIGGSAAFLLNVPQDWGLLFSGILMIALAFAVPRDPALLRS